MQLNDKQKSYRNILIAFILGGTLFEIGYFLIKGQTHLKYTPSIITGAFIASIIGIIVSRTKNR